MGKNAAAIVFISTLTLTLVAFFVAVLHFDVYEQSALFFGYLVAVFGVVLFLLTGIVPTRTNDAGNRKLASYIRSPFIYLSESPSRLLISSILLAMVFVITCIVIVTHVHVVFTPEFNGTEIKISCDNKTLAFASYNRPAKAMVVAGKRDFTFDASGFQTQEKTLKIPWTLPWRKHQVPIDLRYFVDEDALKQSEKWRANALEGSRSGSEYVDWDNAYEEENSDILKLVGQLVESGKSQTIVTVAAPAAAGKGKFARLLIEKVDKPCLTIKLDRKLSQLYAGQFKIENKTYLKIDGVKDWDFKLPSAVDPKGVFHKLVEDKLEQLAKEDVKAVPSDISLVVVDGLDEVHPDTRQAIYGLLLDKKLFDGTPIAPKCVVLLSRPEGFSELYVGQEESLAGVKSRTLSLPIARTKEDALLAWNDFVRWELSDDNHELRDEYLEDIEEFEITFMKLCCSPEFQDTVSFLDILNMLGEDITLGARPKQISELYKSLTEHLIDRNARTHGRPHSTSSTKKDYLRVLETIAAKYSSEVDDDGYFIVNPTDTVLITISDFSREGAPSKHLVRVPVNAFLLHSGFVELKPYRFRRPSFRFVPLWMHRYLANQYIVNE